MSASFDLITIDSPNTDSLALFWRAAVDLVEVQREGGDRWIVLAGHDGRRRLGLQRGPHRVGGLHLDLLCPLGAFDSEVARLLDLGASAHRASRTETYGRIANLADPDGNPFDLCAYEE